VLKAPAFLISENNLSIHEMSVVVTYNTKKQWTTLLNKVFL